jgi:hypothetical protein
VIVLTVTPAESGAAKATASFTDEAGDPAVPLTLAWTLSDERGNIINNRRAVTLMPAASVEWMIYGADLATGGYGTERVLTLSGTYTSTLGANVPLRAQAKFSIEQFVVEL